MTNENYIFGWVIANWNSLAKRAERRTRDKLQSIARSNG